MNRFIYVVVFGMLLSLSSCENFFDQKVEIKLPPHESKLAAIATWSDIDTLLEVYLTASVGALDSASVKDVENAKVSLYKGGELLLVMDYTSEGVYTAIPPSFVEGETYRLEVSAPGFETISAEQVVLPKVALSDMRYIISGDPANWETRGRLTCSLVDDGDTEDYYLISLRGPGGNLSYLEIPSGGYATEAYNFRSVLLSDALFNGRVIKENYDGNVYTKGEEVSVSLSHVSEDFYRYDRTSSAARNAEYNPFAEPVNVYTNIQNGFGIFTLSSTQEFQVIVE